MNLPLPIDYLYRGLSINPQGVAAEDDRESINYSTLVERVESLAQALQQRSLPANSHVALCANNHIDHLVSFLAILAAGCVWIPINPKNGKALNNVLLKKSGPALLLIDPEYVSEMDTDEIPILLLREQGVDTIASLIDSHKGRAFTPVRPRLDAIMAIKFTGGTTGEPKGVMQSHRNVAAVVENMQTAFQFQLTDCNLAVAPLTHGGSHYILPILAVGGRHLCLATPDAKAIRNAFKKRGASVSFMPPTLIYKLIHQKGINSNDFPDLRHLSYSAAPMPPEKISRVIEIIGPRLSTVYGQTEAPMTITSLGAEQMLQPYYQLSVGQACQLSDIAILDKSGQFAKSGEVGEVLVRGDIVMKGYFNDQDKTRMVFKNGWLKTGDLGYLDEHRYLFLRGRVSQLIITGGFNVYPAEIENALMDIPGIVESVVFGQEDEYWGERVEAAVCLNEGEAPDENALKEKIKTLLGPLKTPKKIYFLDALPRNPVGKVVQREVVELIKNEFEQ